MNDWRVLIILTAAMVPVSLWIWEKIRQERIRTETMYHRMRRERTKARIQSGQANPKEMEEYTGRKARQE